MTRNRFCALRHVHRRAHGVAVVGRGQPVGYLHRRVLDDVLDQAIRDLLGDDRAPRRRRGSRRAARRTSRPRAPPRRPRRRPRNLRAAQQPVRLLDDGEVAEPGLAGPGPAGPVRHPQVLGQPDQHGPHQERLVAVVAHVLDLEHGIGPQQLAEVELVTALQEAAGRAEPQAGQPHLDEAEHVVGDPLAVADLLHDPDRGPLEVGEVRVAGVGVGRDRLTQGQVPARVLVHPGQSRAEHLRERLIRPEGRDEQRLDQVRVGLQRKPAAVGVRRGFQRVEPGRDRVRFTRPDPHHLNAPVPGLPPARSSQARGHQPVFGLGRLHHQPRDPGAGGGLEQRPHGLRLPRAGGAADEHMPVQRVERQDERAGRPLAGVQDLADRDRRAPGGRGSWVTSKSGRSASRTPGTSRSGGRDSAATSSVLA